MNLVTSIWNVMFNNILSQPAIFIGLIVVAGYLLLKRKWNEIAAGFIKTVVGYQILQLGIASLRDTVDPLLRGIWQEWSLKAVVLDPNFGLTAANSGLESIGITTSFSMLTLLIAFVWNIVLVFFRKYTKVRTLFTTGHIMVKQSAVATWIIFLLLPELRNMGGIVLIGLLCGTYWSVFSNLTVEATQDLTEGAGFAVGHQQMLGIWFAYCFGGFFRRKRRKTKKKRRLLELRAPDDYVVSSSLMVLLFFGMIMAVLGPELMRQVDASNFGNLLFLVYIFQKCTSFAVSLVVVKTGIRMFVGEMVESFEGISGSVLKGSLPAVDCAATYSFGDSNALTLGFLCGAFGQMIAIAGLLVFKSPLMIIPGFVPLFYDNATIGLYASKKGGFPALLVCCGGSGFLQILGSAGAVFLFQMGSFGGYPGNLDWATLWPAMGVLIRQLRIPGTLLCMAGMLLIPQIQYRKNKECYFTLGIENEIQEVE
ncbi:MAG: PTS transporter subunit IIC [Lachnospiraceae bacterium]|jgi:PTS system ascorbate-specific IIC component|nr:PTS transporter subunit IIC [Lachnospiraceae bacterium]